MHFRSLVASSIAFAVVSVSSASVVDFEDLSGWNFGNPIESGGFSFQFQAEGWGVVDNSYTSFNRVQNGTNTLLAGGPPSATVTMTTVNGSLFGLNKIDSAVFAGNFPNGHIDVVGIDANGGGVVTAFNLTNQWQTFALPSTFNNLVKVVFIDTNQTPGPFGLSPGFQLDNLDVTTVPEPSSLLAAGIGLALLSARRRKR